MMIITDAIQDLQLLSNIGDLAVSGKAVSGTAVDHSSVTVKIGETEILDETLYSDDDGTVWIRDVKTLLKPYIEPASIVTVYVNVDSTTSSFRVMYCMAKIGNATGSNLDMMRGSFPVTSTKKKIGTNTQALLPVFGAYTENTLINMTIEALLSIDGGSPVIKDTTINVLMYSNAVVSYVDVSPKKIRTLLHDQYRIDKYSLLIYGYRVKYDYGGHTPCVSYTIIDDSAITLSYRNAYGVWEQESVCGSIEISRDYALTNAKICGLLKRIDSELSKSNVFTLPLASASDHNIFEAVILSPELKLYDGSWHNITITDYEHNTSSILSSYESVSITYELQDKDHYSIDIEGYDARIFSNVFSQQYN